MQLENEIRQSIHMLNYARMMVFHDEFRKPMLALTIMQFIGGIGTEIVSIVLICNQDTVQEIVMNFIALGIIAEIDDLYASTLYQNKIKEEIEDGKELTIDDDQPAKEIYRNKWYPSAILHKIFKTFYESYYYYFMPFTILIITFA